MAKRAETSAPDGSAGEAASRLAPPWSGCPRARRHDVGDGPGFEPTNELYRNCDFARAQPSPSLKPLRRPSRRRPLSRARKFSCLESIENPQNVEIFALAPLRDKWTSPRGLAQLRHGRLESATMPAAFRASTAQPIGCEIFLACNALEIHETRKLSSSSPRRSAPSRRSSPRFYYRYIEPRLFGRRDRGRESRPGNGA